MNPDSSPDVERTVAQTHPPLSDLLGRQRDQWSRGRREWVETYLQQYPELNSEEETLLDLIYHEFVLRQEMGDRPQMEEYFERFPRQRERLRRQLELDQEVLGGSSRSPTQTAPAAGDARPPIGLGRIGKYPLVALLDEGGQALVYRAVHPELGRDVVVKLSRSNQIDADSDHDRLRQEGRILTELEHPSLARVYDLDVDQNRVFLVMEYVRGRSLDQYAPEAKPAPAQAAALIAQVARALALVHSRGVVHLDVKPKNILIDEAGRPRLIDFGLARWRHCWSDGPPDEGSISGTAAYMAPEQARGDAERVGAASDVFALGGVLYFLLTGRRLYGGESLHETLQHARSCNFDRSALDSPRTPRRLARICLRALAADPAARYARMEELAGDLEAFVRRPGRRLVYAAVVGVLVTFLLASSAWFLSRPAGPAAQPARPDASPPTRAAPDEAALRMNVRVWDRDRYLDLLRTVPLRTGDQFQIVVAGRSSWRVSLFLFTSEGRLKLLAARPPGPDEGVLRFPAEEDQVVPLTGATGTECLLACGRRSGPVSLDEVQAVWGASEAWPALPGKSVLRLRPEKVLVEQRDRDVGAAVDRPDPEAAVVRRLEALRLRLRGHFDSFEGLAFAHEE